MRVAIPQARDDFGDQACRKQRLGDRVVQLARKPLPLFGSRHLLGLLEEPRIVNRQPGALRERLHQALFILRWRVRVAERHAEQPERLA